MARTIDTSYLTPSTLLPGFYELPTILRYSHPTEPPISISGLTHYHINPRGEIHNTLTHRDKAYSWYGGKQRIVLARVKGGKVSFIRWPLVVAVFSNKGRYFSPRSNLCWVRVTNKESGEVTICASAPEVSNLVGLSETHVTAHFNDPNFEWKGVPWLLEKIPVVAPWILNSK